MTIPPRHGASTGKPSADDASVDRDRAAHPLEDSERLAWQATSAAHLLERFGDLLTVALEAVGDSDDAALLAALGERDRLVSQLEPLLADLAVARQSLGAWRFVGGSVDGPAGASERALAGILRPVDEALRYAQLLHVRLADEVRDRAERTDAGRTPRRGAPVALVR